MHLYKCMDDSTVTQLLIYLIALISSYLLPDKTETRFQLGFIGVVSHLIEGKVFTWGQCILEKLYRYLHLIVYRGMRSMSPTTLL